MSTAQPIGRDLYYSITDSSGKSRIEHTRVWDAERFLEAQRAAGAKAEKKEDRYIVALSTRDEYQKSRDRRH